MAQLINRPRNSLVLLAEFSSKQPLGDRSGGLAEVWLGVAVATLRLVNPWYGLAHLDSCSKLNEAHVCVCVCVCVCVIKV